MASTRTDRTRAHAEGKGGQGAPAAEPAYRGPHRERVDALAARGLGDPADHAAAAVQSARLLALLTRDPSAVYAVDVVRTAVNAMLGKRGADLDLDSLTQLREAVRGGTTSNREADYRDLVRFIEARLAAIHRAPRLEGQHLARLHAAVRRRWPTAFAKLTMGHCAEALAAHRRPGSGRRSTRPIGFAVALIVRAGAWGWTARDAEGGQREELRREVQQALRRAK